MWIFHVMCVGKDSILCKGCKPISGANIISFLKNANMYTTPRVVRAIAASGLPNACNSTFGGVDGIQMAVLPC
jgi:hypothetical protein